jgi:CheY-like chemotaxis protein
MPRILVVEDEFLIRLTITEVLDDEGFDVVEAEDGEQALVALQGGGMDLVMTDVNLPGRVNGWAVADAARAGRADMPVIFMSGGAQTPAGRKASAHDLFIQKPYTPADLVAAARRLLVQG